MSSNIDRTISNAKKHSAVVFIGVSVASLLVVLAALFWLFFVKGYVLIVKPDEASTQYSVDVSQGTAFAMGNNLYLLGSQATLTVKAATFQSVQLDIDPQTPENIEIILPPQPASLSATVQAKGETSWYINDVLTHIGPELEQLLSPNEYKIAAQNPYYQPFATTLQLARAEEKTLPVMLTPVQGQATLSANPNDAVIFLDNERVDDTLALSGGRYQVRVEREGYKTLNDTLEITVSQPTAIRSYQLEPEDALITVTATPPNGVLTINEIEKPLGEHTLDANETYRIGYNQPGYFPFVTEITLLPSESRNLPISLTPANGTLVVTSTPQATVLIDGKPVGKTPLDLALSAVTHKLSLTRNGYRTITESVEITANKTLERNFTIMTEYDARRAEGKPLFISGLGISMKGFAPSAYVMGSQPNEPGRRRNEHRLSVDFTRNIFVSVAEITQAQYAKFAGTASSSNKPQTNIDWIDAVKYCNWLSKNEGLPPFYNLSNNRVVSVNKDSLGYRLPTEAEWEWLAKKANRAASTTFVWGNKDRIPRQAGNFADKARSGQQLIVLPDYEDGEADVADVASYRADRLGLYDLAGNVSEWVHDSYTTTVPDVTQTQVDYLGQGASGQRMYKGGNFKTGKLRDLRAAYREPADTASDTIGFRIARYAE